MDNNKILGIVLIVLGAILLLGWLRIPYLEVVVGALLLIVGILMLMGKLAGGTILGVVAIVLGALILLGRTSLFSALGAIWDVIQTVVAILLIVFGVLKLMGKR